MNSKPKGHFGFAWPHLGRVPQHGGLLKRWDSLAGSELVAFVMINI